MRVTSLWFRDRRIRKQAGAQRGNFWTESLSSHHLRANREITTIPEFEEYLQEAKRWDAFEFRAVLENGQVLAQGPKLTDDGRWLGCFPPC